jgi:hypothetical protein
VLSLFDQVLFPVQRGDRPPELRAKPLDQTRDTKQPFKGEEQIEKTLTTDPLKLYLDVEAEFDAIRDRAEDLLWPANQDEARWADAVDRYAEQAGMPWLPPRGLDDVQRLALSRGRWEDLGNGYISKPPSRKSTSVQVVAAGVPDDSGMVRLQLPRCRPLRPARDGRAGHVGEHAHTAQPAVLRQRRAQGRAARCPDRSRQVHVGQQRAARRIRLYRAGRHRR